MTDRTSAYSMPGTHFFDLAPAAGGEPYRIFLSIPRQPPPAEGWPLLVLTDGNATFPFAHASLATQADYPSGTNIGWGVIAAIGYPTEAPYDAFRRSWDLGPPPVKTYPPFVEGGPPVVIGGTDALLDFIEDRLLPRIAQMTDLDASRRTLFGHSFGGLFTLYALFERPGLFANWVSASPSIYWEDCEILRNEARRRDASGHSTFVHLSAGGYEGDALPPFLARQPDAAVLLEKQKRERTVSLAREMAQRLDGAADGIRAEFEVYPGETHMSVLAVGISRAVGIAFAVQR